MCEGSAGYLEIQDVPEARQLPIHYSTVILSFTSACQEDAQTGTSDLARRRNAAVVVVKTKRQSHGDLCSFLVCARSVERERKCWPGGDSTRALTSDTRLARPMGRSEIWLCSRMGQRLDRHGEYISTASQNHFDKHFGKYQTNCGTIRRRSRLGLLCLKCRVL
jgi:hypothetical protein